MENSYNKIRSSLNTGDIVLFSGTTPFSTMIRLYNNSKWSHVGMILNLKEYDYVTLWESTPSSKLKDLDTDRKNKGVQLVPLSLKVKNYIESGGEIAIRQLQNVQFSKNDINELMKLRRQLSGVKYEKNLVELLNATYKGPFGYDEEDLASIFCSEMVAGVYQRVG